MTATALYEAKIKTGKYDHYNNEAKAMLFLDCIEQCEMMERVNEKSKLNLQYTANR